MVIQRLDRNVGTPLDGTTFLLWGGYVPCPEAFCNRERQAQPNPPDAVVHLPPPYGICMSRSLLHTRTMRTLSLSTR
jgi:hypothetical protein